MVYIALLIAVGSLAFAWASNRRLARIESQLSRYHSSMYELSTQIEEIQQRVEQETADIRFEIRKRAGEVNFTPAMTIGEITSQHPLASTILANFHVGGCHSCAVNSTEVLGEVCNTRGLDQNAILAALNRLGTGGSTEPAMQTKQPNVQLMM